MDFWISRWISGFQIGFLDFVWISRFLVGFLDFALDFGFLVGFLPTVYEISGVSDPSCLALQSQSFRLTTSTKIPARREQPSINPRNSEGGSGACLV